MFMNGFEMVIAILSLVGGGFSWWYANGSRKARTEAEAAERRAQIEAASAQSVAYEARKQSREMQRLATSLEKQVEATKHELEIAQKQAATLQELTDGFKPPALEMEYSAGDTWLLKNNSNSTIQVSELLNRGEFDLVRHLDTPFDILPLASRSVMLVGTRRPKCSKTLQLKLSTGSVVSVPFTPRPKNR